MGTKKAGGGLSLAKKTAAVSSEKVSDAPAVSFKEFGLAKDELISMETDEHTSPSHLPAPSEDVVRYLDRFCSYWRSRLSKTPGTATKDSDLGSRSFHDTKEYDTDEKVELLPGFPKVLINRKLRNAVTRKYRKKPLLMGTQLLKLIYSKEDLKNWTARGMESGEGGIPSNTMDAVEAYVAVYSTGISDKFSAQFTKAVNNMLQDLRSDTKRCRKKTTEKHLRGGNGKKGDFDDEDVEEEEEEEEGEREEEDEDNEEDKDLGEENQLDADGTACRVLNFNEF